MIVSSCYNHFTIHNLPTKVYKTIWQKLEKFSIYSPQTVNYKRLKEILKELAEWYFRDGGIFMTEVTRDTYFKLRKELTETVISGVNSGIQKRLLEDEQTSRNNKSKDEILNYKLH
jgi:hypothetical protein